MELSGQNLSADSTKQQLMDYLDNFFRTLPCANPKHKHSHIEICLKSPNQSADNSHQPYQLLCHSCKRENSYQCTAEKHETTDLIETLRSLIEQSEHNSTLAASGNLAQLRTQDQADEQIKHVISEMKVALSGLKNARAMLEEQIAKLESDKFKLEDELNLKNNQSRQRLKEFKQLLVQILKQDNSQYFQQHISQLKGFTEIDAEGQMRVCLDQEKKNAPEFLSDYGEQIKELDISINKWIRKFPTVPARTNEHQNQWQNETLASFSFLLNGQKTQQDQKILLINVDKFNKRNLQMKAVYKSDLHKKYLLINTAEECVASIKRLCSNSNLSPSYLALAKFMLGFCEFYGVGCKKNEKNSFSLFLESDQCLHEKNGYGVAQNWIGYCYKNGKGVEQNCAQAAKYYRMAAEQGHGAAQYNLGCLYYSGHGVQQNLYEAKKLFKLAADQGIEEARDALKNTQ